MLEKLPRYLMSSLQNILLMVIATSFVSAELQSECNALNNVGDRKTLYNDHSCFIAHTTNTMCMSLSNDDCTDLPGYRHHLAVVLRKDQWTAVRSFLDNIGGGNVCLGGTVAPGEWLWHTDIDTITINHDTDWMGPIDSHQNTKVLVSWYQHDELDDYFDASWPYVCQYYPKIPLKLKEDASLNRVEEVFHTTTSGILAQCLRECSNRFPLCKGVNYNAGGGTCELCSHNSDLGATAHASQENFVHFKIL